MIKPKEFGNRLGFGRQSSRRFPAAWLLAPLALTLLCSCRSITYDMRQLQQPVVLNDNPFLAATTNGPGLELVNVDSYAATISDANVTASAGNTTTTTRTAANEGQVKAFTKIGGQPNRAIRNVSLEAKFLAINLLLALADEVGIQATGDVAEFPLPVVPEAALSGTNITVTAANITAQATNDVPKIQITNAVSPAASSVVVETNANTTANLSVTNSPVTVTNQTISAPTLLPQGTNP